MTGPAVAGADVRLRDVTEADLPTFFEQQLDPEAVRMAAFPSRGRDAFDAHWERVLADDSVIVKTILFDGNVAGNISSWKEPGERLVGYWLGREYWGRGIATRALAQFLAVVGERPMTARVAKHNVASFRVLEKCGFVVAGERRDPADGVEELVMRIGEVRGSQP